MKALIYFAFAVLICSVATAQQRVRIGEAIAPLNGPWKFHIGDDPRWADPDFDDSSWEKVDFTPKGATDYLTGVSEYVPGWTALGHSGYSGYAWYRLKVRIEQPGTPLSLLMPFYVDDGYQVFANGMQIGQWGDLNRRPPVLYFSNAGWFPLPAERAGQSTQFALRLFMDPSTLVQPDSGGLHGPPHIGAAGVIAAFGNLARQRYVMLDASYLPIFIVGFGFAFALFALYWLDRTGTVYLWFGLAYLALAVADLTTVLSAVATNMSVSWEDCNFGLQGCWVGFLLTAWWEWFALKEMRWLIWLSWGAVLARTVGKVGADHPFLGTVIPLGWLAALEWVVSSAELAIGALLVLLIVFGIRRQGREGWLALPAALLFAVSLFSAELVRMHVPVLWTPFGLRIDLRQAAEIALAAVLGVLIIRRFQRSQRRKQQLEADLRQAQQLQQVLLPQEIPQIKSFRIECEYWPAQEVGGDFFQVVEARAGGMLVTIGDVSGKGVHAAMLVALIIGALRTIAEETEAPEQILRRLNQRLVGRMESGFATCLCARISHDGAMTVANAGHLAPWLNGNEIQVPHQLPLGLVEGAEYSVDNVSIPESATLTFISDGVVEAQNGNRELFGFERVREISMRRATEIAEAARQFGQDDDITVVTIERVAVSAYA